MVKVQEPKPSCCLFILKILFLFSSWVHTLQRRQSSSLPCPQPSQILSHLFENSSRGMRTFLCLFGMKWLSKQSQGVGIARAHGRHLLGTMLTSENQKTSKGDQIMPTGRVPSYRYHSQRWMFVSLKAGSAKRKGPFLPGLWGSLDIILTGYWLVLGLHTQNLHLPFWCLVLLG